MKYRVCDILHSIYDRLCAANIDGYMLDAEILLSEAMGIDRLELVLQKEKEFPAELIGTLEEFIALRIKRKPISHIVQKKEFFGLEFFVNDSVIAPRPETELIVELAIKYFRQIRRGHKCISRNISILDLGTGSGCIIVSVLYALKNINDVDAVAVDISENALEVARFNFARHIDSDKRIRFIKSDWFEALEESYSNKFDLILCNPPYVSLSEWQNLMPEVRKYEPLSAISDGDSGLMNYIKIAERMVDFLGRDGVAIFECGHNQLYDVCNVMTRSGFIICETGKDLAGMDRTIVVKL